MEKQIGRREVITLLGAAGAGLALGCGGDTPTSPTAPTGGTTTGGTTNSACAVTPAETIGPFPSLTDLIRSDIREGKSGTTLTLTITVVNTNNSCGPVSGANVEIWQCDAAGSYSQYGTQQSETYPGNSNDRCQWAGDVYDDLSGLVPGARDAYPCRRRAERSVGESHPDRVPGSDERCCIWDRCLRVPRLKPDREYR